MDRVKIQCFILLLYMTCIGFGFKIEVVPSSGVILERLQDVTITSSAWTFVLNYEMDQFREDQIILQNMAKDLEHVYTPVSSIYPRFQPEMTKIKSAMASYIKGAQDLLNLLQPKGKRNRRGLMNFISEASKWAFGTATDHDVTMLKAQIDELKYETRSTKHIVKNHMTIITKMEQKIESNSQHLKEVTNTFLNFTSVLKDNFSKQYSTLSKRIDNNYLYSHIASNFRQLELTISEAKFQLIELKSAIYSSSSGQLNPALIDPERLEEALLGLQMISSIPVTFPDFKILQRYSLASVSNVATSSSLIFFVTIPVFTPDSSFDAFIPHSYPVYDIRIDNWLELDLDPSVLLLSHDELYYSVLPLSEYRRCIHETITICFDAQKVRSRNVPHCLLNIYMNSTDSCNYLMREPAVKPYINRIQDSVIYSTDVKTTIHANCPNMQYIPIHIEGHGIVRNISTCTVSSTHEKIFPTLKEKVGNFSQRPSLDIPSFNWTLSSITNKSDVLTFDLNTTNEALHHLRDEMARNDGGVKLSSLISAVNDMNSDRYHKQITGIVGGTILGIIIVVALIIIFIKMCRSKKYREIQAAAPYRNPSRGKNFV